MTANFGLPATISAMLAALLVACGGGSSEPASAVADSDGAALYARACGACHGAAVQGTSRGPALLDPVYRPGHHADAAFLLAVRGGARAHHWNFGNMPPIPGLSDTQVAAIIVFVRERQRVAGVE